MAKIIQGQLDLPEHVCTFIEMSASFDFNSLETYQEVIRTSKKYQSRVPRPQVDIGTT